MVGKRTRILQEKSDGNAEKNVLIKFGRSTKCVLKISVLPGKFEPVGKNSPQKVIQFEHSFSHIIQTLIFDRMINSLIVLCHDETRGENEKDGMGLVTTKSKTKKQEILIMRKMDLGNILIVPVQNRLQALAMDASHSSIEFLENMHGRNAKTAMDLANAEKVYELTTPSHTENLEMIRNFISHLAQKAGLDEMAAMEIEVAVEEACVNAIKHAHRNDKTKPLRLQIKIDKQKLKVLVRDEGQGIDPKQLDEQKARELLAKPKPGGRGILMMKMLMDEVHFEIGNGKGMQVRLVKHLASSQKIGCLWKNVAQSS